MTPQDIITTARHILLDNDPLGSSAYRQSDSELLIYVNEAVAEASVLAPQFFLAGGDLTCIQGVAEQTVDYADAQRFVAVLKVKNGNSVNEADLETFDRYDPSWSNADAGPAVNWMKATNGDPRRFYIYPKAPPGQILEILYVRNPDVYSLTDTITQLPDAARTALANYVVARAESKDDEHVNSGRAVAYFTLFRQFFQPQQGAAQ